MAYASAAMKLSHMTTLSKVRLDGLGKIKKL